MTHTRIAAILPMTFACIGIVSGLPPVATCEELETPPSADDRWVSLGAVDIDVVEREVHVPVEVNMREGMIELLLCGVDGKRHESVLVTHARPLDIQLALILLGLRPGTLEDPESAASRAQMDRVTIEVAWDEEAAERTPAETLVAGVDTLEPMSVRDWIFLGSRIQDGRFLADGEQTIVATYHDPAAILDNSGADASNDELWMANEKVLPAVGTRGTVVLRSAGAPGR